MTAVGGRPILTPQGTQLGFTCRSSLPRTTAPTRVPNPLQRASAMLGTPITA
ncbi:hypothetical protein [Streptomyces sp. ICC1]|uniref:hypothetical protein n=1 Tax=Streptomyces sp. ICC1 TaxID=2099583 RepID=UPI0013A6E37C|nr:hypothetical protein [Streptomyces sp. ICC1]